MYAAASSSLLPSRVLFISRGESSVRTDVKALRGLGIGEIKHITDSERAFAHLEQERSAGKGTAQQADLILCDDQLADSPVSVFLFKLSQLSGLRARPVLVISGSSDSARLLRSAGVSVLERPYTPAALERMLQDAISPLRKILRPENFRNVESKGLALTPRAAPKPAPPVHNVLTTTDVYKQGVEHLKKNNIAGAERAFAQVLARKPDHVEACLGMARVQRVKGDTGQMHRRLVQAAATCLRADERTRAATIAAMLPSGMRNNVFIQEAVFLMEENDYRSAARSFLDADRDTADVPLHQLISRSCLKMPKPEDSMHQLCDGLEAIGHKTTASVLRRRLLKYPEFVPTDRSTWLDKHPALKEAVNVVSYSTWAWKQA